MNLNVVHAARSWLGTPFYLHGRVKYTGCDCLGLVIGVALELDLRDRFARPVAAFDRTGYHLLSNGCLLHTILTQHFKVNSCMTAGNLALFSFDNNPAHLGIIGDYPGDRFSVIHANAVIGKVVEHRLSGVLKQNLFQVYEFGE